MLLFRCSDLLDIKEVNELLQNRINTHLLGIYTLLSYSDMSYSETFGAGWYLV